MLVCRIKDDVQENFIDLENSLSESQLKLFSYGSDAKQTIQLL